MADGDQPSSEHVRTVGVVLTWLPLHCCQCRHVFREIIEGAVLDVKRDLPVLISADGAANLLLRCPRCDSTALDVMCLV